MLFRTLRDAGKLAETLNLDPKRATPGAIAEYVELIAFLNHFELVAIAIENFSLDEALYREWSRTSYVRTWMDAQSVVRDYRKEKQFEAAFSKFESRARAWATAEELKVLDGGP